LRELGGARETRNTGLFGETKLFEEIAKSIASAPVPSSSILPELLKSLIPTATRTVEFVAGISDPGAELSRKPPMRG
jgi:hypothetical protein